ncbi:MAG: hypothetical protein ABSF95_14115 [Verrucomicrobiota bacterium]|jgi:DNA repair exonuclease SbcCD ATPase subunit
MNPWNKTSKTEPAGAVAPGTIPAPPSSSASAPASSGGAAPAAAAAGQAQTDRLNAEAIKLVAEANESRARQLRELEEITACLQRNLVAEAARLKQLDEELRGREAKVRESEGLYQEGAELKRQAETQALENRRALADAQARMAEAQKAEQRASQEQESNAAAALQAQNERAKSQAALEQLQAESARVETARAQALAAQQETQRLREETEQLQAQSWPAGLRAESWRSWRERVIRRAAAEPAAGILVARLHTAAALERAGRPLTLELVRDIGGSVYETAPEDAEKIAQALAQAAGGRFEIKTVRVGDRIDKRFMQPSAAGLVEVRAVSSWAIRDASGKWQFLAEVS